MHQGRGPGKENTSELHVYGVAEKNVGRYQMEKYNYYIKSTEVNGTKHF